MFSPCLFYDYYWANKFVDVRGYLVESGPGDPSFIKWKLFRYEYDTYPGIARSFKSPNGVGTFFVARKGKGSTFGVVPIQGQFLDRFVKTVENSHQSPYVARVKKYVPALIKKLYRYFRALKRQSGNLEYLGKI